MASTSLDDLAHELNVPAAQIVELIERTCARLPQQRYYVFRVGPDSRGTGGSADRPRTIAAFPSPDDALAFAQRNGYTVSAQLRPIAAVDLVKLLLRDAKVGTVLFLQSLSGDEQVRGFPPGVSVTRQGMLEQLAPGGRTQIELTAKAFDTLQFGVDFRRRGAFRVALTEAVDAVVASYVPPPGSLDSGPRSVYATSVVEGWLRENGFPHAMQRRWIDVAGEPTWDGADELCEIDCGTQQRLLVQLLIHTDGERQFIGRVVVTS